MEKDVDKNEYLTFEEALAFTGLSKDAFKRVFCGEDNKFRKVDGKIRIARSVLGEYMNGGQEITEKEQKLLDRLESGEFDGPVGDEFVSGTGTTSRMVIECGTPRRYRRKAGCYYSEHYGEMREYDESVKKEWLSDSEKLTFLGKYGFLFDDEDVKKYNRERMSEEEW